MRKRLIAAVGLLMVVGALSVATTTPVSGRAAGGSPTASLEPGSVEAGDPVTVSGTGCANSPVLATVTPTAGGDPVIDDEEQTTGDDVGAWSFEIDTTDLAAGTYTVDTRCVLADGQGFDYNVLTFVVTAPEVPEEPEEPEVPAEPAPAEPTFTG